MSILPSPHPPLRGRPPAAYGRLCLRQLGWEWPDPVEQCRQQLSVETAWADSHLAPLIGTADRPLACTLNLPACADDVRDALNLLVPAGRRITWLGRRILGMRRLSHPLSRRGTVSPSGTCRLLAAADGVLAVNLPRNEDWELLPAWLECPVVPDWTAVARAASIIDSEGLLERARLLGLAVAPMNPPLPTAHWFEAERLGVARLPAAGTRPRVLDLSSLWAGPLCSQLLRLGGAEVIRVEHPQRPDGARRGPGLFFDTLNAGKQTLALDLRLPAQRERFLEELSRADILIEAFRPRVWRHLGIDPQACIAERPGLSWISITGYGRDGPQGNWPAFGDDAAVAAGLSYAMEQQCGERLIVGDAIADPLTGLHAALAAQAAFLGGGGVLMSVPLSQVVAHCLNFLLSPT